MTLGNQRPRARAQRILEFLFRTGSLNVQDLCDQLGASPATVRRELAALERQGRLRRTHGGAIAVEPLLYESFRHDSSFQEQIERNAEEKRRIASAAAELIQDGDTIALTPGTTTTQLTRSIPPRRGVTVITNTVNVAMELSKREDLSVLVTGGNLRGGWFSLVGPLTVQTMSQVFADKVFIGVNGIDARRGLTTRNPDEAAVNRVMIAQGKQKIVVADHSKIGIVANYLMSPLEAVNILITDTGATDEAIAPLVRKGIEVRRV